MIDFLESLFVIAAFAGGALFLITCFHEYFKAKGW